MAMLQFIDTQFEISLFVPVDVDDTVLHNWGFARVPMRASPKEGVLS